MESVGLDELERALRGAESRGIVLNLRQVGANIDGDFMVLEGATALALIERLREAERLSAYHLECWEGVAEDWSDACRARDEHLRSWQSATVECDRRAVRIRELEARHDKLANLVRGLVAESGHHACREHAGGTKPGHSYCAELCPSFVKALRAAIDEGGR